MFYGGYVFYGGAFLRKRLFLAGNQALRASTVVVARGARFSSLSLAEIRSPKEFQRLPPHPLFKTFLGNLNCSRRMKSMGAALHKCSRRVGAPEIGQETEAHARGASREGAVPSRRGV